MFKRLLASAALAAALVTPVQANTINIGTGGAVTDIPGLTGFQTTGALMSGLQVTACFGAVPTCETRSWATTGPSAGGVIGTNWSLSVDGDTFTAGIWSFVTDGGAGQLVSLLLDGRDAFTIFDRTTTIPNATGTPGSAQGRDFSTVQDVGIDIDVTYLDPTTIGGTLFADDLFQQVLISFRPDANGGLTGPRISFDFSQDTDNDIRITLVPEPGSLALLAVAALALGLARRRRS